MKWFVTDREEKIPRNMSVESVKELWKQIKNNYKEYYCILLLCVFMAIIGAAIFHKGKNITQLDSIGILILILALILLIGTLLKPEKTKNPPNETNKIPKSWEIEYQECSEDRRHFTTLSWGIPAAILLVSGAIISVATKFHHPLSTILILLAAVFSLILTWNFKKIAYYAEERRKRLERIGNAMEFERYSSTQKNQSPWWAQKLVGHHWMFWFLVVYTLGLFILAVLDFSSMLDPFIIRAELAVSLNTKQNFEQLTIL